MKALRRLLLPLLVLAASCHEDGPEAVSGDPAIMLKLESVTSCEARIRVSSIDCEAVGYTLEGAGAVTGGREETSSAEASTLFLTFDKLEPSTDYVLKAWGLGAGGSKGKTEQLSFSTVAGATKLYPWEKARSAPPVPADMTLIPGPSSHRNPLAWDEERWLSHVAYSDAAGTEHWLFDSFLLIEGQQTGVYGQPGYTYVLTSDNVASADRVLWQQLLDFWFKGGTFLWQESSWGDGVNTYGRSYSGGMVSPSPHFDDGQLTALDRCIGSVASRIGAPSSKRLVIMALPEPVYFDNYALGVANPASANTLYWGEIDGKAMDFSKTSDRIRAYTWFMDEVRAAFARKGYENIELGGFYILPEVLDLNWRAEYKRYDEVIPAVAEYAHSCNEGLFWIPYNMAAGYDKWKDFGFDMAYMQPNHYWDESGDKPMSKTFSEISRLGMGLELEFEYSMVENVNGPDSAAKYRARFDDYLSWARTGGVYGRKPLALYSGTDAMHQLATSPLPEDVATYRKLCEFIIASPLKK